MSVMILIFLSLLSGSLIKFTDDIEDKNLKRYRNFSIPGGISYGLAMGYLMLIDPDAALLFGGIVLGCLAAGKIDSIGHRFGLSAILIVVFLNGIQISPLVLVIAILAAVDEFKDKFRFPKFMEYVFEYRLILKFGILILVFLNLIGLNALIALLAFDAAYILTDRIPWRSNEI